MEKFTYITITLKKNNFFINLLLQNGKSFYSSGGKERFSGKQKSSAIAFSAACYKILTILQKQKIFNNVVIKFKGTSYKSGLENEFNSFLNIYTKFTRIPKINSIIDVTPIFFGNIKTKKMRRI